jgi:tetratricopeptide (TPR) repeat protein
MESVDLYAYVAPYRHLLGLPDYRQQTMEACLGTGRTEDADGKELIDTYKKYLHLPSLEMLDRLPEAADAFYKAVWSAETAGTAFFHLGCIRLRQGQAAEALRMAEESLLRGGHDMKTRSLKASALRKLRGDTPEYRRFLEESLAIDPLYMPLLFRQAGGETFRRMAGESPEDYLNTAYEFLRFGCPEDTAEVLAACPAESPMKYYAKAYAEGRLGQTGAAKSDAEKAESLSTDLCFPNRTEEKLRPALSRSVPGDRRRRAPRFRGRRDRRFRKAHRCSRKNRRSPGRLEGR